MQVPIVDELDPALSTITIWVRWSGTMSLDNVDSGKGSRGRPQIFQDGSQKKVWIMEKIGYLGL